MKNKNTWVKWVAAATAVAGIAYLVVRYFDQIQAWISKLCPCCRLEDDFVVPAPEEAPAAEAPAAEEPAEAPATEAPAEETAPVVDDGSPVAEDSDFEA